jgi:hypothetical protein
MHEGRVAGGGSFAVYAAQDDTGLGVIPRRGDGAESPADGAGTGFQQGIPR